MGQNHKSWPKQPIYFQPIIKHIIYYLLGIKIIPSDQT